jgi:hypothetical protein
MPTKFLIMYKLTFLFLIISFYVNAQVVPIGTVILGKRLPSLATTSDPDIRNSSATLHGSIKINDSKLTIVENGFVVLPTSDPRVPNFYNAAKYAVAAGIQNFETTINNFASNTDYKYRAYAINSKGEIAYSQIITFTTNTNWCEVNPCKNAATCTSTDSGPLCTCTVSFCGNCCAQLADPQNNCPGGADQQCIGNARLVNPYLKIINISESVAMKNTWYKSKVSFSNMSNDKIGNK